MSDTEELAAIRARAKAATEGPWSVEYDNNDDYESGISDGDYPYALRGPANVTAQSPTVSDTWRENYGHRINELSEMLTPDAEFIAHARADIPALLDALAARHAVIAEASESLRGFLGLPADRTLAILAQVPADALAAHDAELTAKVRRETLAGGAGMIAAERARQVAEEGYDAEHDRGHAPELIGAAREYAAISRFEVWNPGLAHPELIPPQIEWPWHRDYFKPTGDPVRDLTKAGALIAAAIDALAAPTEGTD